MIDPYFYDLWSWSSDIRIVWGHNGQYCLQEIRNPKVNYHLL